MGFPSLREHGESTARFKYTELAIAMRSEGNSETLCSLRSLTPSLCSFFFHLGMSRTLTTRWKDKTAASPDNKKKRSRRTMEETRARQSIKPAIVSPLRVQSRTTIHISYVYLAPYTLDGERKYSMGRGYRQGPHTWREDPTLLDPNAPNGARSPQD